jgi:hypothetical protein
VIIIFSCWREDDAVKGYWVPFAESNLSGSDRDETGFWRYSDCDTSIGQIRIECSGVIQADLIIPAVAVFSSTIFLQPFEPISRSAFLDFVEDRFSVLLRDFVREFIRKRKITSEKAF